MGCLRLAGSLKLEVSCAKEPYKRDYILQIISDAEGDGDTYVCNGNAQERWGAGVETHKNVRREIGGWGREPFNETYAPSLSTIYDGA